MSNSPDGGQDKFDLCPHDLSEDKFTCGTLLPCEIDQAKPDRISRLARSTNLSKILEGDPPERDPWDRGSSFDAGVSSNLMRSPLFQTRSESQAFWRELFKITKAFASCQHRILTFSMRAIPSIQRRNPQVRRSADSQRTTGKMPAPSGEQKHMLLGLAMGMFSLGIPYRGSGVTLANLS